MGKIWADSGAWPDLISAMHLAFTGKQTSDEADTMVSRWIQLPGLCCLAAGGDDAWADDLTLAWLLFYAAADLMDSVQDNDALYEWQQDQKPGAILAATSGLYFSGSLVLEGLHQQPGTSQAAADIIKDFYSAFLIMTSGQHLDLTTGVSTLVEYWRLAEAKSGTFFQLASMAGARLACDDREVLQAYRDYGLHLGLLIQVMDDLQDIRLLHSLLPAGFKPKIKSSLPFVYALELSPAPIRERLLACLEYADQSQGAVDELVALLDQCQAALYVRAEIERLRQSALAGLVRANPLQTHKEALIKLVNDI